MRLPDWRNVVASLRAHGALEWRVVISLMLAVAAVWTFAALTDEVQEGETLDVDERIVMLMRRDDDPSRPIGPRWLATMGRDVTALGDMVILFIVIAAVAGFLALEGHRLTAFFLVVATTTGQAVSSVLKAIIGRERPDVVPHLAEVSSASFPSGHSMMAAVVYLTLGILLAQMQLRRRTRVFTLAVAVFVTGVVGVSRVYLGVHYPTDVLAGWLVGGTWALLSVLAFRFFREWMAGRSVEG